MDYSRLTHLPYHLALISAVLFAPDISAGQRQTQLLWGDTHLHTSYSPDAFFMQNRVSDPDMAFRWARGVPVVHPYSGVRVQIDRPLDFLVVADHAEMMAVPLRLMNGDPALANTETGKKWIRMIKQGEDRKVFRFEFGGAILNKTPIADFDKPEIKRSAWNHVIANADRHNQPGQFTALIGWEWTSMPDKANLHRVVFMANGEDVASQFLPFSALDSDRPEDLWAWLDKTSRQTGADFVSIPHNPNISKGQMFATVDSDGNPFNRTYINTRMRWEPVAEVTQIKGDSEAHPALSPKDEFADFETYSHILAGDSAPGKPRAFAGDYARSALKRGLELEAAIFEAPGRTVM